MSHRARLVPIAELVVYLVAGLVPAQVSAAGSRAAERGRRDAEKLAKVVLRAHEIGRGEPGRRGRAGIRADGGTNLVVSGGAYLLRK